MKTTMLNGLPVTMLNGVGCACENKQRQERLGLFGFAGVNDYDIIVIGGQRYTANQILDRRLIASRNTPIYRGSELSKTNPQAFRTVPAGQEIGKVYSYLKPSGITGKSALMFYDGFNFTGTPYYTLNEDNTVSTQYLKEQGALTISQELEKEKEEREKADNPIAYYLKKLGLPVLLIGGAIYLAGTYGKEVIKAKLK